MKFSTVLLVLCVLSLAMPYAMTAEVVPAPPIPAIPTPAPREVTPAQERLAKQEQKAIESYLDYVAWQVKRYNRYPKYAYEKGLTGRVVLRFTVRRDGAIISPGIIEHAGHFVFQQAALRALKRVGQLPPFPAAIRRSVILVEIPVSYAFGD